MLPRPIETLADGSWLAELRPSGNAGRHAEPLIIRVIDYEIDDGRPNDNTYRLFTTILDPNEASATDLAMAYSQRWEIEAVFDELKVHQRGPRTVLRSKSPDLVLQEIWGHLCCHYAIRTLMWEAAGHARVDPDRVSFVAALRIARRSISAARDFSPLSALTTDGATPSSCCVDGSTRPADTAATPESSNASTSAGTSNAPDTATGPNRPDHPPPPSPAPN